MSFADEVRAEETGEQERKLASLKAERDRWKNLHDRAARDLAELEARYQAVTGLTEAKLRPPKWTAPKRPKRHEAIVTAILSDCHWDEVVKPSEIGGVNAYDREIGTLRLHKWATGLVDQATHYVQGVDIAGATVMLGGDMLSGELHDLKETNEGHMPDTLVYWAERLAAALTLLADAFGKVDCPAVVGNHGRRTRKPRTKGKVRDNYDWLLYQMVALHLSGDDRITIRPSDHSDQFVDVYDAPYLLNHGDQTKGGGGVGGIWPPIMRMAGRKRQRYGQDFVLVLAHWHQLIMAPGQGLIVNGSLKGYDEFAAEMNFPPERPQQAAWLTTPENGPTLQFPVFCDDRKAEGW